MVTPSKQLVNFQKLNCPNTSLNSIDIIFNLLEKLVISKKEKEREGNEKQD